MTGTVSGIRAMLAVRAALDKVGLVRTSTMNGGEIDGWIPLNHFNAAGQGLRPDKDGTLKWFVTISGKPHMRYRDHDHVERRDDDEAEIVTLHEPKNPMVVAPRIKAAFESLGLVVKGVDCIGHQGMWDDDVNFAIVTDTPEWLERHDKDNRNEYQGDAPRLLSVSIRPMPMPTRAELPAYEVGFRRFGLTREAVDVLVAAVVNETRYDGQPVGTAEVEADGTLHVVRAGRKPDPFMLRAGIRRDNGGIGVGIQPERIVNHWGDEVEVWVVPHAWLEVCPRFTTDVPVVIGGERVVRPSFDVLDAQFGDDVPWRPAEPEPVEEVVLAPSAPGLRR